MKKFISYFSLAVMFAASAGQCTKTASANEPTPFDLRASKARACTCGKWTCPVCQCQQPQCPPANQLPGLPPPIVVNPNVPSTSQPQNNTPSTQPSTNPSTNTSPNTSTAPNNTSGAGSGGAQSDNFDVSRFANTNLDAGRSGFGSDYFANAVEFQGDAFGSNALSSVIVIDYSLTGLTGTPFGSGLYSFNVAGPNDFATTQAPTLSGGVFAGSATAPLGTPTVAADNVNRPSDPSFAFNGGTASASTSYGSPTGPWSLNYSYSKSIVIPSSPTGRMKLAENVSPLPRDRVFFNYSLFSNVPFTQNGIQVNRFTPGFEKTFWSKQASLEFRMPFATTLDSNVFTDGSSGTHHGEFGNLFFTLKGLLWTTDRWAFTSGASFTAPTADDVRVLLPDGNEVLRVKNQSVHVMPFFGTVFMPRSRSFVQSIIQVDVPTNGNSVITSDPFTGGRTNIGKLNDFTMLYCDFATGYWVYRAPRNRGYIVQGIIPTAEAHYNRSLTQADSVSAANGSNIRGPLANFDNVNVNAGLTFQLINNTRVSTGYVVPIGNGADRMFSSEMRFMVNRFF